MPIGKDSIKTRVAKVAPAEVAEAPATETVAAVIGHDEKKAADKVKIGQKLPTHLL